MNVIIYNLKHLKDISFKMFIKYFYELTSHGVNSCFSY